LNPQKYVALFVTKYRQRCRALDSKLGRELCRQPNPALNLNLNLNINVRLNLNLNLNLIHQSYPSLFGSLFGAFYRQKNR